MIAAVVAKLVGLGIAPKAARAVVTIGALVAAVLAFVLLWNVWLARHDSRVVTEHNAQSVATAQAEARAADEASAEQARAADARNTAEGAELGKVIANDPGTSAPVTDSRRAYLRCVRLQQAARASGKPAPAC